MLMLYMLLCDDARNASAVCTDVIYNNAVCADAAQANTAFADDIHTSALLVSAVHGSDVYADAVHARAVHNSVVCDDAVHASVECIDDVHASDVRAGVRMGLPNFPANDQGKHEQKWGTMSPRFPRFPRHYKGIVNLTKYFCFVFGSGKIPHTGDTESLKVCG